MLTEDNKEPAKAIAKQVEIQHVFAEVLPQDKASKVEKLQAQGKLIGMVVYGINDTHAMAMSSVSVFINALRLRNFQPSNSNSL
ncbi:MAG: Cu+-exporting ATPase [bacterium]|jgi:Cu+-exporting ATPase